ncbi:hypothetical protein WJX82_001404 [Trebouxia sp. C0006]
MFVHEFLRGIIRSNMENPVERDAKAHDHMYKTKATADKLVAMWNQPSKTYGFWNTDRANAKYHTNLDPAIQRLSGRHHPYED